VQTHTCGRETGGFEAGWAADEWERFVKVWNVTPNAVPWTPLLAPATWLEHAASPGWLSRAAEAMERLPACRWFDSPVAVTKFFDWVDRILAGEFDGPKPDNGKRRQLAGGNL